MQKQTHSKTPARKMPPRLAGQESRIDVIDLILEDHKPLKELIRIMKNDDLDLSKRKAAFEKFAPLLVAHAKPEERALYELMKQDDELREEAFEGDVEHGLADQMIEEAKRTDDKDELSARIKVLAELVEHHIEEEEEEMFPRLRREIGREERGAIADEYLMYQQEIESEGSDDAPPESEIQGRQSHNHGRRI
jgi:hemerythrin-like domain-containing protein